MRYLAIKNPKSDNQITLIPESQVSYFTYDNGKFKAHIKQESISNYGVKQVIDCGHEVPWNEFDGKRKDWKLA
jgi:hypothetical protein